MRGQQVENCHRGALALIDADGGTVLAMGDVTTPIFSRSPVKAPRVMAPLLFEPGADQIS